MQHAIIITGGYLNIEFAKKYIKTLSYDKVFAVDKGLEYADLLGILPDYLIGDFDTVDEDILSQYERKINMRELHSKVERYPVKKDATDTELALWKAMEIGANKITILAGMGSRMDHVFSTMHLLLQTVKKQMDVYVVDETNRIRIMTGEDKHICRIDKKEQYGDYVSLIPLTSEVTGVTIKGALYPLENATIYQSESLTVSNQILDEQIEISIQSGKMLLIESKD